MRPINAGNYRHKITFQTATAATDVVDSFGARTPDWVDFWTTWAAIEPIGGRELATLRSQGGTETHRIKCRYFPGANVTMQIRYGPADQFDDAFDSAFSGGVGATPPRLFRITSISNVEERNYDLWIMAEEYLHP